MNEKCSLPITMQHGDAKIILEISEEARQKMIDELGIDVLPIFITQLTSFMEKEKNACE
jgi:hypothetical protein